MSKIQISEDILNDLLKELPQLILDMLPDTPNKLLKYAKRSEKIKFSKNLDDSVKKLMKSHLLTDKEYLRTFLYSMAITFYNKTPVIHPKISIVAAQTGSGKSNLTAKLLRENSNYIFVDSDKYKHFRNDAQEISKNYQVLYPFLTAPDCYDCAANIYEYGIRNKFNIIKETAPSLNKGLLDVSVDELIKNNYTISVHILAVGEINSMLSLHERYEKQILTGLRTAKLTCLDRHNESYNALIKNVNEILIDSNISEINVYSRGSKEENFTPKKVFPSNIYKTPIEAIEKTRIIDNIKAKEEFNDRYNLILQQMKSRNTPKEQYNQLEEINKNLN